MGKAVDVAVDPEQVCKYLCIVQTTGVEEVNARKGQGLWELEQRRWYHSKVSSTPHL